ncbi:TerB family tellurite resistance protein [Reichenbachiella carrageenanivorans]|uniref:TerB family tellurite resistance protein n=1 Tax=Reichenbachiella carrageenanivorans TaxID=2979869 RepID=A0ABY6D3K0_9BACT|nr:TerB family tellurite resistance protein [Reichenbachiella carrageenanivorans]UXX80736.1 TerB family tellurite resistance protein [Reichenbachiella carrageenanivorans]
MDYRTQMSILIQLALVDNQLSQTEKRMIYTLGKANKIPEVELDSLFNESLSKKKHELPPLTNLSEEDKFEYLYHLIQLMKVDKKVYLSEIKFCEELAERLGYKKRVVKELSSRIFGDPAFGSSRDTLLTIIEKHKLI